ncbi:MAG TPA: hypothetical protein VKG38_18195, partial [Solirubrobacteraceae bacterium]|nr:hypothetical protein [Solirubrobacteraceae bacterium]
HKGTVSEIRASSGAVINTISTGENPVEVSSDGTHVWVANGGDTVSEISTSYPVAKGQAKKKAKGQAKKKP